MSEKHKYTNRLIHEKSPYLLQHAHNPVDWYPWGNEAFSLSQVEDKPIFLSIGYATCHWCHVMEKESFDNVEVAKLLNENFVNIKVDREELPEVDLLYMEFAQSMMSGAAGWPLNLILTPDLKPFFAATYLPPEEKQGIMGLKELVARIREVWHGKERENIVEQADKIVEAFAQSLHTKGSDLPDEQLIEENAELLLQLADPIYGGMKGEPKFPIGYQYNFLLREAKISGDSRTVFIVERSLDMMHKGGIYDHIGGGFSRYSVDEKWLVPHFEKMLYDNALLIDAYLEAWQATKIERYKKITTEIALYIIIDMMQPEGGFYSAEDADSEGKEGYFYTWDYNEIVSLLGDRDSDLFCNYFGVTKEGNFHGRNILYTPLHLEDFANKYQIDKKVLESKIELQRKILLNRRKERKRPLKDDKILSGWNGLMIHSLASAGAALERYDFTRVAEGAAEFIYSHMWDRKQLFRRWREGEKGFPAGLDEYASMIRGSITLFEVGRGAKWLRFAIELAKILEETFKESGGAFYQTDGKDRNILLRKCQYSDGAEPSGNSLHCENLIRLYNITGEENYLSQAEEILKAVKKSLENYSPGYCYHAMNLLRYYDKKSPTFVISLNEKKEQLSKIMQMIYSRFIPHKSLVIRNERDEELLKMLPYLNEQPPLGGKTTLYTCLRGVCDRPITDIEEMKQRINSF